MNTSYVCKSHNIRVIRNTIIGWAYILALFHRFLDGIFALDPIFQFWYFIVSLAIGLEFNWDFMFIRKNIVHKSNESGKILAISGTTSTGAMIPCCAHYLVNILPILGVTGFVSIISQYQIKLFLDRNCI